MSYKKKLSRFFGSLHLEKKYLLPAWLSCLNIDEHSENLKRKTNVDELFSTKNIFNNNIKNLRSAQLYHFKYYLPMVLSKVDQASMLNSVESRSPFISKKIINFSLDQDINKLYSLFNKKKFLKKVYKSSISKKICSNSSFIVGFILNEDSAGGAFKDYSFHLGVREFFLNDTHYGLKNYLDNF